MIDEKDLDKADSMLTKGWSLLRKHWGKLLIILIVYGMYRFGCAVSAEMDKADQYAPVENVDAYQPYDTNVPEENAAVYYDSLNEQ